MDPITLIPYTIFLLSMQAFWTKDKFVPVNQIKKEERIVIDNSVYQCIEEQRLMTQKTHLKNLIMEQCKGDECD